MSSLALASKFAILVFGISTMLSVGLGLTLTQIIHPLRSPRLIFSALAANFLIVPTVAYCITRVISLDRTLAIGILLAGTGAGAPGLPKLIEFAKGNLAFAVGLMVLLMTGSVMYMPLALPILLPVGHISPWSIAKQLITVMSIPLACGLFVRSRKMTIAKRFEPYFRTVSTIALAATIVLVVAANYGKAVRVINVHAILAAILLPVVSFGFGYLMGGPGADTRIAMAFGTAQRDLSAALLVAVQNFSEPIIVVTLLAVAIIGVCTQIPMALALGRKATSASRSGSAD